MNRKWSKDAKALWKSVTTEYKLEPHHLTLLDGACDLLSRAAAAREVLERDGPTCLDRYNVPKTHPAVDIERSSLNSARLLLRELNLDATPPDPNKTRLPRGGNYR